jgi:hypothetical protein
MRAWEKGRLSGNREAIVRNPAWLAIAKLIPCETIPVYMKTTKALTQRGHLKAAPQGKHRVSPVFAKASTWQAG